MRRVVSCSLLTWLLAWVLGCAAHKVPTSSCAPIGEFPGAEDFDLVELDGRSLIVASASARRPEFDAAEDGFYAVDLAGGTVERLALHGRDGCPLAPHGIATTEVEAGRWELWAIVHYQPEGCGGEANGIERYRVETDGLHFVERITGPELVNPNELDALPDGRLWLSNNPRWDQGKGLAGDMIFHRAKGQILHYDPSAGLSVAARGFVFPNGVAFVDGALWISSAYGKVYRLELDGQGHERSREVWSVAPRATLDNFIEVDGELWLAGHPKALAFVKHGKRPKVPSPTVAYRVSPAETPTLTAVSQWRRGEVNAGSTVAPVGDALVLGMVFDRGLRVCERAP